MKNRRLGIALCSALSWTFTGISAQEAPKLPDEFVFKNEVPDFSAWTITCLYSSAEQDHVSKQEAYSAAMRKMAQDHPGIAKFLSVNPSFATLKPRVEKIQVTKTGNTRREDIFYFGGKTEQRWCLPEAYIQKDAFSDRVLFESGVVENSSPAFPELAWISSKKFRGGGTKAGRKILVFQSREQKLSLEDPRQYNRIQGSDDEEGIVTVKALIDQETQMPISLEWDGQSRSYQFGPPPSSPQVLPPDLAAILDKSVKRAAAASRALSPP